MKTEQFITLLTLSPHLALTPETFLVRKLDLQWVHLHHRSQQLLNRVKLLLLPPPDIFLPRLELARLEHFRYSFNNSVNSAVCTVLISLFWCFHLNGKKISLLLFFVCICNSSLKKKKRHTVFSSKSETWKFMVSFGSQKTSHSKFYTCFFT